MRGLAASVAGALVFGLLSGPVAPTAIAEPAHRSALLPKTTISGYATTAAAVLVGGEVRDWVKVTPGSGRLVTIQKRRKGATAWLTASSSTASSTGGVLAEFKPTSAGVWQYRLRVSASDGAAAATSAVRVVTATGRASGTSLDGFATKASTVPAGGQATDEITITPGSHRYLSVQRRKAGGSAYTTVYRTSTNGRGQVTVRYAPPSSGGWDFRVYVYASATARAVTSKVRRITARAPTTPVVKGWYAHASTIAFGDRPQVKVTLTGVGEDDEVGVQTEARLALPGGAWSAWQVTDGVWSMGGLAFPTLVIPSPGKWQVRVVTLGSASHLPAISATRVVTMTAPDCTGLLSAEVDGTTYSQCDIQVRPDEGRDAQRYVLQWTGAVSLADLHPDALAVYFHGDGSDVHWPVDDMGTLQPDTYDAQDAWALARGYLLVKPIGPDSSGSPKWGATQSLFDWSMALGIGRDLHGLGLVFGTNTFLYWGHSGGSWFLSDSFIPAGIELAPGPVALNCGASAPWDPEGSGPIGPYDTWMWQPKLRAGLRAKIAIQFNYGDKDFLADSIYWAQKKYAHLGFVTQKNVYPGVDHCGKDFSSDTIAWFTAHLPPP